MTGVTRGDGTEGGEGGKGEGGKREILACGWTNQGSTRGPSRPKKPSVAYIERIFGNQAALLNLNIKSLTFFGWEQ